MTYNVISGTDLNDCLWAASKLAKLAWCGKAYVYEYYGVYHVSRYEVDVTGYRLVAEVEENFVQPPSDCELPYQEVRDYLRNREAQYIAQPVEWR